jgi:hypothetical protein
MDELFSWAALDNITTAGTWVAVAILVITDKLVAGKRLTASEAQRLRWETIALEALRSGANAGVTAAETTVDLVSALPPATGKD